jgi:hypothetical protein
MTQYATNADLLALVPSVYDQGESDFTDELVMATADVQRDIEVEWLKQGFRKGDGNTRFDADLLVGTQWKRATMYKALADYIMPSLSPFREDDSFQLQMKFYKSRYAEETGAEFARGIQYDANDDGTIDDTDYFEAPQDRLYR